MKFIKRFMAVILTILLFAVSVAGCASSKEQASDMLTREEWIAMLMEAYHMDECYNTTPVFADVSTQSEYFVQIQSCAEWEIVDKTSRFYPELTATNLFAIVTAVRAVGLDKVEKTKDAPSLESAEEIADYFLQQTNMKLDMSDDLTAKTAQQILDASLELAAGLVLEQYHDLQYQDGVLEISENDIAIDYEKQTAELHGIQAEAGTVIVVSPSATLPDGLMAKVTSVDGTRISFENAEMEEVIDSLLLYGTYAPEILRVTPLTDGVTAEYGEEASASAAEALSAYTVPKAQTLGLSGSAPSVQSMLKKEIEVEDAVLKLDKKLEENGAQVRINGSVGIKDILVTAELDCSLMKFNKASLQVDSTIAADISVSAKLDRTFKLAKIECRLWKVVGVDFIVSLHIDLNGNISVEFSVENCEGVSYKPDAKPKCFAKFQKPELEAQVQVQASAEPSITAELVIGPWSVTNIGAEVDLNAEAKVLSTEDGLTCTDVKMYVLVSAFVGREAQNGDETLLAKFGVQKNWDIWTKDNTKMKKAWHVENAQVVPACTREENVYEEKSFDAFKNSQDFTNDTQNSLNSGAKSCSDGEFYYYVSGTLIDDTYLDSHIIKETKDGNEQEVIYNSDNEISNLSLYENKLYFIDDNNLVQLNITDRNSIVLDTFEYFADYIIYNDKLYEFGTKDYNSSRGYIGGCFSEIDFNEDVTKSSALFYYGSAYYRHGVTEESQLSSITRITSAVIVDDWLYFQWTASMNGKFGIGCVSLNEDTHNPINYEFYYFPDEINPTSSMQIANDRLFFLSSINQVAYFDLSTKEWEIIDIQFSQTSNAITSKGYYVLSNTIYVFTSHDVYLIDLSSKIARRVESYLEILKDNNIYEDNFGFFPDNFIFEGECFINLGQYIYRPSDGTGPDGTTGIHRDLISLNDVINAKYKENKS